ncbi:MAG: FmdB family zinc ribbon protein [bacterium]|jgi:putative FmdB family regulatory protein
MPIFEFYCSNCNQHFELLCKYSEKPADPKCPHCNDTNTKQLLNKFAVHGQEKSAGSTCSTCSGGDCSRCH